MKEVMMVYNEFAVKVALALQTAGVRPAGDEMITSVMVVVGKEPYPPMAGAINWDVKTQTWQVDDSLQQGEPVRAS